MANTIRIALLGNTTTEYTGNYLHEECGIYDLEACIYNVPYLQYRQEILDPQSGFYASSPELAILMLEGCELFPHWYEFKTLAADAAFKEKEIHDIADGLIYLVEAIHSKSNNTLIIINNFRIPYSSPLGILDNRMAPGLRQMISALNHRLEEFASRTDYAYVFDYGGFCANTGQSGPQDHKMYYLAKCALTIAATKFLAHEYIRYILPFKSRSKKCLVLDLDNTLWGGIAGEDGAAGISLDITGTGSSYYNFQKEILNLYDRGILLALCSKNNPEDAFEILEKHPHMLLTKKHFSCIKINWQDKAANLLEISRELNIGIDSLVFFDDNPVEREFVKAVLPQVTVVDVPKDSSRYCEALKSLAEFESLKITEEDIGRNELYALNAKQQELKQTADSRDEFLAGLQTRMTVGYADEFTIPRIAQLTQKTNQFNMTTKRYQISDIANMASDCRYVVLHCSVSDRLGDSGTVGCCIASVSQADAEIDTFLLSCRVLGRDIEYAFLSSAVRLLRSKGIDKITAKYIQTGKNKANRSFYLQAGFQPINEGPGSIEYILPAGIEPVIPKYISTTIEQHTPADGAYQPNNTYIPGGHNDG